MCIVCILFVLAVTKTNVHLAGLPEESYQCVIPDKGVKRHAKTAGYERNSP